MIRTNTFLLLSQEGHLISSCLATGLTELRNANVHNKGAFYTSLFNLSIGLERLMKAVVIVDHMLSNNMAPPTKKILKSYGHNILELYDTCFGIAVEWGGCIGSYKGLDEIDRELLQLLSDFALMSRYHNLDSLDSSVNEIDPLAQWDGILLKILNVDVSKKSVEKILNAARSVSRAISDTTHVSMTGLSKEPLTLEDALALPGLHDQATRFAILRLVKVISPFRNLLAKVSEAAYYDQKLSSPPVPLMGEFLDWIWDDRKYVLRKRRWP